MAEKQLPEESGNTNDDQTSCVSCVQASSSPGDGEEIHVVFQKGLLRCQSGGSSIGSLSSPDSSGISFQASLSIGSDLPESEESSRASRETEELRKDIATLRQEMSSQIEELKTKITQRDNQLEAKNAELQKKNELIEKKNEELSKMKDLLEWKDRKLEQKEKEKQWKQDELEHKDVMLKHKDEKIRSLQEEKEKLLTDLQNMTHDVTSLKKEIENLRNQRDELKKEFDEMQEKIHEIPQNGNIDKQSPTRIEKALKDNQAVLSRVTQVLSRVESQHVQQTQGQQLENNPPGNDKNGNGGPRPTSKS